MDKFGLLQNIEQLATAKQITPEELMAAYNRGTGQSIQPAQIAQSADTATNPKATTDLALNKHLAIGDILYYLGGAIVFIGISVMVAGSWGALSPITRILVTLGTGVAAYIAGVMFSQYERYDGVAQAFYLISGLVMPMGLYVTLTTAGIDAESNSLQSIISLILLGTYALSAVVFKKAIFTMFTIIYGTWFFFAITQAMIGSNLDNTYSFDLSLYRVLIVGLAYMVLGYAFTKKEDLQGLTGLLYGFGSLGFLGAALALGGFGTDKSIFWELVYPLLVFGIIFLSVYVKSRAFLIWGAIFLMAYILKITGAYFSSGLGWPLALVMAGLMLIAVGYYTVYINKRYITQ